MAKANYVSADFKENIELYRDALKDILRTARGKENAKSRGELSLELGITDRELRDLSADCVRNQNWPILSSSGGKGYFYPSTDPEKAIEELEAYQLENQSRIEKLKPKCSMANYWIHRARTQEWW